MPKTHLQKIVFVFVLLTFPCVSVSAPIERSGAEAAEAWAQAQAIPEVDVYIYGNPSVIEDGFLYIGERSLNRARVVEILESGEWNTVQVLEPLDANDDQIFGVSTAVSGNTLVVGASGLGEASGAVYFYERDESGTWLERQKITAAGERFLDRSEFGSSVTVHGDTLVVGYSSPASFSLPSIAFVYQRSDAGTWEPAQVLQPSSPHAPRDFGSDLTFSSAADQLFVGAHDDGPAGDARGAVYVYEFDPDAGWAEVQLIRPDRMGTARFGSEIVSNEDTLVIGAPQSDRPNTSSTGMVLIYTRGSDGTWEETQILELDPDGDTVFFGEALGLDDGLLAVGARGDDTLGRASGSVSVFTPDASGDWQEEQVIRYVEATGVQSRLGATIAVDGDRIFTTADGFGGIVLARGPVEPALDIVGSCPGKLTFTGSGLTPYAVVGLYRSTDQGTGEIEAGSCSGTEIDLAPPVTLEFVARVDGEGRAAVAMPFAAAACGAYVQLVDATLCETSLAVQVPE